jgi:RNA polymerase sigma factor (sigma-70 family)
MQEVELDATIREHHQAVLRTAYRLLRTHEDANDAAQEVLLRMLGNRARIRGNLGAWLYRVTINVCNDHCRNRKPTFELRPRLADPAPGPDCLFGVWEREHLLREGLSILKKRELASVVLRHLRSYSTAEIGAMLDLTEATVRRDIRSARTKLAA